MFDDVPVPVANRIGEEGEGWRYANFLLGNERTSYAHVAGKRMKMAAIRSLIGQHPELREDPAVVRSLKDLEVRLDALDVTVLRVLVSIADGASPGDESSILKILATEVAQNIGELEMHVRGLHATARFGDGMPDAAAARATVQYLSDRAQSIYGGSNEIQKNIIAKRVLGLH